MPLMQTGWQLVVHRPPLPRAELTVQALLQHSVLHALAAALQTADLTAPLLSRWHLTLVLELWQGAFLAAGQQWGWHSDLSRCASGLLAPARLAGNCWEPLGHLHSRHTSISRQQSCTAPLQACCHRDTGGHLGNLSAIHPLVLSNLCRIHLQKRATLMPIRPGAICWSLPWPGALICLLELRHSPGGLSWEAASAAEPAC